MARDFRKIRAWQLADALALGVYDATRGFPKSEVFGMTSQVRRAAVSIAANIVEGSARQHSASIFNSSTWRPVLLPKPGTIWTSRAGSAT